MIKICSVHLLWREVMLLVPHVKEHYRAWVRCFVSKISRTLCLTHDSPASIPDGSVCWIRMIRLAFWGSGLATCSSYALT
jgi:hypothetical protein